MISLPEEFRNKTINRFGDLAIDWLNNVDSIMEKYKEKFKLKDIQVLEKLTINVVLYAYSEIYGDVIIKLGIPNKAIINEINYIKNCNSIYMVKCHYYNLEDRIIILERIKPGLSLKTEPKREERIKLFCNIVNDILMIANEKETNYRRYDSSSIERLKKNNNLDADMKIRVENAKKLFESINQMNLKEYILHRDLHHKNILKSDKGWKVIDPHGVIGYKVFEIPQFIKAELEIEKNNIDKMQEITKEISKELGEDINLIYKALYIDTVSKIIFYISSGYEQEIIDYNKKICDEILKII